MKDKKHLVLLIDDDSDMLDSTRMILEAEGYQVKTAGSAEEGLRTCKATNPDIVFVDLMMEEIDAGTNFVTALRALGSTIPVYLLTSVGDSMNQNTDYASLGLTGVLQKPVSPTTLLMTLKIKLK